MVDHRAGSRVPGYVPDGIAVLDDVVACPEVPQDHFMAPGDVRQQCNAFDGLAFQQVLQGHRHVVGRIDFNVLH